MQVPAYFRQRVLPPLGAAAALIAGLAIGGAFPHNPAAMSASGAATSSVLAPSLTPSGAPASYADVVSKATPAVVTVRIEKRAESSPDTAFQDDPFFRRFFGAPNGRQMPSPIEHGVGSGVIVSADGDILTNNHVVEGADHVTVALTDGREFTAKVVGTDPATDLAVVHINASNLPVLPLGDSDKARVGDVVLAVGNPLDVGQTVTMGIISAKGRRAELGGNDEYEDFLQTDAPINQGNSGGALIESNGELIGINSQILSTSGGNIGIGFAIPSNMARNVMTQLVKTGHVRRAMLGVTVQPITSDLAQSLNLSAVRGALVSSVETDGPAAQAGVKQGDVILKINGTEITDSNDLRNRVSAMTPGSTATIDVDRNGHQQQLTVKLAELPAESKTNAASPSGGGSSLGMALEPLTPSDARQLDVPRSVQGLVVTNVDPTGAAANAGLQEGDVIRQVNGTPVKSEAELRDALAKSGSRPALTLVQRGQTSFYATLHASK